MGLDTTTATLKSSIYRRNPQPIGVGQGFQETRKLDPHIQVLIQFEVSRQRGQPTHITNGPVRGPATAMGNPLSPLASLCLGVVRGWINVARRKKTRQVSQISRASKFEWPVAPQTKLLSLSLGSFAEKIFKLFLPLAFRQHCLL